VRFRKEREHLDLWLMLKENIEWKSFMKTPVYVVPGGEEGCVQGGGAQTEDEQLQGGIL
jgi:hypothetical protein